MAGAAEKADNKSRRIRFMGADNTMAQTLASVFRFSSISRNLLNAADSE